VLQTIAFVMCIGTTCVPYQLNFWRGGNGTDLAPISYPSWCGEMGPAYIEAGLGGRAFSSYHAGYVHGSWLRFDHELVGLPFIYMPDSVQCWPNNTGPI
jgi:hypothetical protein